MALADCIKRIKTLQKEDIETVQGAYNLYIDSGYTEAAAEEAAVNDLIATVESEKQEYIDLIYEQHPDLNPETAGQEAAEEAPTEAPVDTKKIDKLRKAADAMENAIDAKMNPAVGDQNPTPRRSRILAGMQAEGRKMQRIQSMLRGIADRLEDGTLPESLANIDAKTQIETLLNNEDMPRVMWRPHDSKELEEAIKGLRGIKEDREFFKSRFDWRDGYLNRQETEVLDRLIKAARKAGRKLFQYSYIDDLVKSFNRVKKMGFETQEQWTAAREALEDMEKPPSPEQERAIAIDRMERELIGTKIPGWFPTPPERINRMIEEADIQPGDKVLEPSAGNGEIMDRIRTAVPDAELEGVEISHTLRKILEAKDHNLVGDNFLEFKGGPYDKILMNPPFENNQDIQHIKHAYSLLKPGGRLVSIVSEHSYFANDKASVEFREWVNDKDSFDEQMSGEFKKGRLRTTGVNSRMLGINKPEEAAPVEEKPAEKPKLKPKSQRVALEKRPENYRVLSREEPTGETTVIVQSRSNNKDRWANTTIPEGVDYKEYLSSRGIDVDAVPVVKQSWNPKTKRYTTHEQPVAPKPETVLEDFGEKLGGARKDTYERIRQELSDDYIAANPLSKIWPKKDIDDIEDNFIAAFGKTFRDTVPNKPRRPAAVRRWVEKVKEARTAFIGVVDMLASGRVTQEQFWEIAQQPQYIGLRRSIFPKVRLLNHIDREQWGRIEHVEERPDAYTYGKDYRDKIPRPHSSVKIDGRTYSFYENSTGKIEEAFKDIDTLLSGETEKTGPKMKFQLRTNTTGSRGKGKYFIHKFGDKARRPLKLFDDLEAARKYIKENYDDLVAAWEHMKEMYNVKKEDVRRKTNVPRTGQDYRKGVDVTPEHFMETFGFRGVEFGNWVKQGKGARDRQGMLNQTYDALMDLANIVGVPPRAISLNGELGLGLGSRGRGTAMAHFEPSKIVINLTKPSGAGSLAHEWFHSLDNYFQRKREKPLTHEGAYITYRPETYYKGPRGYTLSETRFNKAMGINKDEWVKIEGVRPEVEEGFVELVKALDASPMRIRAEGIDMGRSKPYWSTIIERAARSFENYIISKMQQDGYENDFLANIVSPGAFIRDPSGYPYLLPDEIPPIAQAFDNLFSLMKTRETDKGTEIYSKVMPGTFEALDSVADKKPSKHISVENLRKLMDKFQRDHLGMNDLAFHIRATQDEAFGPASASYMGFVKGGFNSGSDDVVLIAENIRDINDAMTVIRHEIVGHYGLRNLLNKEGEYDALLARVYAARNKDMKPEYDWVAENYPELVRERRNAKIADEMLARAAETQNKSNLFTKIYDLFIKLLRKFGLVGDEVSRGEVNALLRMSLKNLRNTVGYRAQAEVDIPYMVGQEQDPGLKMDVPEEGVPTHFTHQAFRRVDYPTMGNLGMPDETAVDRFVRYFQNAFNRVKKLQDTIVERGGTVNIAGDVYLAEELSSGKTAARMARLEREHMKPLVEQMKQDNITIEELDEYLMAMHAKERNRYIASINKDMPDGGSGITDMEADAILRRLRDREEVLINAAERVYAVNDQHITDLVEGGHITQETAQEWRERWDYYVPLKGKAGEELLPKSKGKGYSVRGSGIKEALGRGAGNIAESPTAHSFAQAESAIIRTEKTKVGQALVQLVRDNPDAEFWTISQRTYKRFVDIFGEPFEGYEDAPEGMIEGIDYHRVKAVTPQEEKAAQEEGRRPVPQVVYRLDPNYANREDVFSVMVDGKELLINIKDKVLAEQLKRMNASQLNALMRGFGVVNRYLAMINTALNPEFVITNFERDFQTAMVNLGGEQSARMALDVAKSIPSAIKGIWQATFSNKRSEWSELYEEMRDEGGTIGFFGLEDIETKVKRIQRKLEHKDNILGRTQRGILNVRDVVLDANLSVENAARLASYKIAKEQWMANGMPEAEAKARAASLAKNLTVNFNRKGELAPVLNSAYLFYNASIQGSARIFSALKHERVRKIVGGVMATAFALAVYNRVVGGDDDDGIPHWDKISDYTKQTNLIIMHPDGSGNYSKIRLPYGYNVFFYTGTAMQDMMYGKDKSVVQTAMNILSAAMNAFNPIQGADVADTVTPTVLKPYFQDVRNMNFMGAPIRPEYPFDQYERPESQKFFKSTNPMLRDVMAALNDVTGGDETHAGWLDWSPETVKHYVGWLTGGAGLTATRTLGTTVNLLTGEDVEMKNVPFIRTLGGQPGRHYDTERYYNAIKAVAAVKKQADLYRGTDDYAEYKERNFAVHRLSFQVNRYKKRIARLRDQRDKAYVDDNNELANEFSERIRQEMMEFSLKYDNAIAEQED